MKVSELPPEVAAHFHLHELEMPTDPDEQHKALDAIFRFGDCPMDNLQAIQNLARNASTILPAPRIPKLPPGTPVVAIGSGPSLESHLETLLAIQHRCVMVAASSAVKGLRRAGIEPHFTTPMERTEDMLPFTPQGGPHVTFAGSPFVAKPVMDCFERFAFNPDCNPVCQWGAITGDEMIFYGSSTGTTAVSLACSMTDGPVYLVGHDLAYDSDRSHFDGAQSLPMEKLGTVDGNSGEQVESCWLWRRYRAMIGDVCGIHKKVINTNILAKRGATIANTLPGSLTDVLSMPIFLLTDGKRYPERLVHWKRLAKVLPMDARRAIKKFEVARTVDELDISKAIPGQNGYLLAYLMGCIYVQLSLEIAPNLPGKKCVATEKQAVEWCRTATINCLRESMGVFEEVASYGRSA